MGILIIITVLVFEVAFMSYCVKTSNNQIEARSWVRVALFIIFLAAIPTSIIEWSFRWYLLVALLAVFAVIGAIRLITKKFGNRPFRGARIVSKGIIMLLIITIASIPAIVFPQHARRITTGEYKVGTVSYTFTDTSRIEAFTNAGEYHKLNVECWYPTEAEGKYPFIAFSHGAFSVKMSNTSTFMEFAVTDMLSVL